MLDLLYLYLNYRLDREERRPKLKKRHRPDAVITEQEATNLTWECCSAWEKPPAFIPHHPPWILALGRMLSAEQGRISYGTALWGCWVLPAHSRAPPGAHPALEFVLFWVKQLKTRVEITNDVAVPGPARWEPKLEQGHTGDPEQ